VAAAYAEAGRYEEAAREVDIAVRAHPRDVTLRRQAAEIHQEAGNTGKAIGHLESALRVTPSDAQIWIVLGDIETRRDNAADAYVAYRRATELAPNEIRAVSGLALAADHLGFEEEAEAAYARWAVLEAELGIDTLPANGE
jgi:cytochrome c-type biogenesis protein CcmH/NrfG